MAIIIVALIRPTQDSNVTVIRHNESLIPEPALGRPNYYLVEKFVMAIHAFLENYTSIEQLSWRTKASSNGQIDIATALRRDTGEALTVAMIEGLESKFPQPYYTLYHYLNLIHQLILQKILPLDNEAYTPRLSLLLIDDKAGILRMVGNDPAIYYYDESAEKDEHYELLKTHRLLSITQSWYGESIELHHHSIAVHADDLSSNILKANYWINYEFVSQSMLLSSAFIACYQQFTQSQFNIALIKINALNLHLLKTGLFNIPSSLINPITGNDLIFDIKHIQTNEVSEWLLNAHQLLSKTQLFSEKFIDDIHNAIIDSFNHYLFTHHPHVIGQHLISGEQIIENSTKFTLAPSQKNFLSTEEQEAYSKHLKNSPYQINMVLTHQAVSQTGYGFQISIHPNLSFVLFDNQGKGYSLSIVMQGNQLHSLFLFDNEYSALDYITEHILFFMQQQNANTNINDANYLVHEAKHFFGYPSRAVDIETLQYYRHNKEPQPLNNDESFKGRQNIVYITPELDIQDLSTFYPLIDNTLIEYEPNNVSETTTVPAIEKK